MLHTLLFNRSDRARFQFSGAQITATLNGLVTNDVALLTPGQGQFAGILTPKSKVMADVRIFMGPAGIAPDGYLMDTSPATAGSVRDFLKKYLNPRFAKHTDITDTTCQLGIFGDSARAIVATAASIDSDALATLAPYGHTSGVIQGVSVVIVRTPELDVEGYDIIAPKEHESTLIDLLTASGATLADAATH